MGEMSYEEEIITGSLTRRILAQTLCFVFLGKWGGKFVKKCTTFELTRAVHMPKFIFQPLKREEISVQLHEVISSFDQNVKIRTSVLIAFRTKAVRCR